ncbi:B-cell CLL/lymphoma 9 protein [Oncorhynchus tshawytscha]|uniref:B-cell lymphoma 9 beta-catenin binding domain-containing protein n=1 Tax=Oncorhynchus tshawytscha TaxID=74940 RepID=A0A8C8BYS7_ONCTS|nr:B-cell CLL/lymphoma 9 protein [Oncorhynchus tshawytscha]XP_024265019.1 B-cell CLL/lymphoma 9 protein [Oncorhynchus tshawytscha]XP_024265027.1 B-cell CLL/lymphoma 9 protein [Oncorhynchus tshawytscha]XP_024265032.1 B-cell CLL/lymphoma 9 protein [Oncorhynchus tshawytscha]
MLEVQEERPAAAGGTAATHFSKKERGKKEREEAKDGRGNLGNIGNSALGSGGRGNGRGKAPHTHTGSPHQLITPPCSVVLGAPSIHHNRLKNSPSTNTQSPKPKPEGMVRSPPVMSPSGGAAQMDSKLPNQSKPGSAGSQSQASPCDPKTVGGKGSQQGGMSGVGPGGMGGLKNGQGLNSGGQGTKVKVKRERSTSVESYNEQQTGIATPTSDDKDSNRVKRMCVAERRQPYSGADWCSGGESDEDDKGFFNCNSSDVKPQDSNSHPPPNAGLSRSSTPSHNALGGQGAASESGGQKAGSKVVYVFTTEMANKAADAVLTGHSENIINFHMRNISNSKDKIPLPPLNDQARPLRGDSKPSQQSSSHSSDKNHQTGSKPGPTDQAPPQPPPQGVKPGSLTQDGASSADMDPKNLHGSSPGNTMGPGDQTPGCQPQPEQGMPPLNPPQPGEGGGLGPIGMGQPGLTPQQQQQQLAQELLNMEANTEGLSQEQLEHRQRSLQTLRDIQRMLFPDDRDAPPPPGPIGGLPQSHDGMPDGGPRRPEQGPLQAMMAQSQSLGPPGGSGGSRPQGTPFGPPHGHPRDMPPFPDELGHMMGPGGCGDGDHMTPEQVAWLKLQQEFYEEKKRKQEMHHRPLPPDMMMHPHGPRGMMRGPPPPYQMGPGEVWGPGGPPEHYHDRMAMGPRGMPPHMQRMPGFPQGMMNPDMEGPPRPGMGWPEDMPPRMGDGRGFPGGPGGMFGGPGVRGERFPNPQSVQEAMFHQGMGGDKGPGLPPQMMMEMQRMMGHQRGGMEPGNGGGMMFPRMPGEGPMSPSSRLVVMGSRDMGPEFGMGPHGNPQLREGPMNMSPDEMMRMRGHPMDNMGPQGRQMHFTDQPQPGDFPMGPARPFPGGPGSMRGPHGEQVYAGPEHRTTPTGGNGRLNHHPPSAGPPQGQRGRKPAELIIQPGGGSSPSINPLKSPPLRQVQSPMMGSPSGNLKSPQTPSQLAGMLSGPPGPNGPPNTANSAPMKSPHSMMGSAGASPVNMRSPSLPNPSPGWASSPKPPMPSPGIPQQQGGKTPLSMTSPNMMGNMEQGGNGPLSAPPSSGAQSGSMPLQGGPGSAPTGSPYSLPPEPTLSQNPLSIMMSRMSKFAMPSSTPLYHDAIKTVASSDDDSPPARSPNLPSMNNNGMGMNHHQGPPRMMGPGSSGPMPVLSPLGMTPVGSQPLSHGMPQQMPSPNPPNMGPGPGMMPHGMMMHPNPQDQGMGNPQMMPQGRMGYPHRGQGYPLPQSPSQQGAYSPHNGPVPQGFPGHPMGFQGEGGPMGGRMGNMPPGGGGDGGRPNNPGGPQFNMHGEFSDVDLHEVMRTGASGMPEFDLSRIIPSEKPSQTLSYFPRGGGDGPGPGGKPPHMQGMMQGMMGEGPPRMGMPMQGLGGMPGGPGGTMGPQDMPMGNPSHNPMRAHGPPGFMGQGMMGPQHRMMSQGGPAGMMQGKERGVLYNHPGPGGSPNMMMSLQGMGVPPQQTTMMMMGGQMRPRGMDMDMGFSPGPGMF